MKIAFEGQFWELDPKHISFQQAMVIQSYTGMSIGDWEDSIDVEADEDGKLKNPPPEWLKSVGAVYWLMHAQGGGKIAIAEMDFDFPAFLDAFVEGIAAEVERVRAQAAPDPTPPSPSPPDDPLSLAPGSRTATTRTPRARPGGGHDTAS